MAEAFVIDAVRTASGKGKKGGALSGVHPVDLLAGVLSTLVERTGIDPQLVDDVIGGCVMQVGEQSMNVTRNAVFAAGFPETVPATSIDRACGSSQQAAHFAAQGVQAGAYDLVIACGVESMSRVPIGVSNAGVDEEGPLLHSRYPEGLIHQGVSAELLAARWKLDRETLDAYAALSHARADAAGKAGHFAREVVPVTLPDGTIHSVDETVRGGTTLESLSGLKPAFTDPAMAERFPEIDWSITPGNSSPLTDGASAVLIASEAMAARLGLTPRARFVGFSVVGDDPIAMLTGPIPATRKVLERTGLTIDEIDAYEVNEAFAPVPLAWAHDVNADPERLNSFGGAISLGHALGSTGTRLLTTLINRLEIGGGRYGLQTLCERGGMANAMVIERV